MTRAGLHPSLDFNFNFNFNNERMTSMIKINRIAIATFLALATTALVAQSDAQKSFEQLKSLAGSWEGKNAKGEPLQVSFRSTAAGSALMNEIITSNRGHDMITMIHLDGSGRLLLTHYCSAGNQPRMVAGTSPDGKTFTFRFLDVTNLASPDAGHMDHVVITILDADHHTEEWVFADHGKEMTEMFDLKRKS
jgi:hypothetical protein